jgi:acetyl esterase/lipase
MAAVEYSKGYGTTYPRPVEQVNAALGFLARNAADFQIDPARIVLAGDSAGAQIASQVALITTDPAYATRVGISPQLKAEQLPAVLLLSGAFDVSSLNLEGEFGWFLRTVLWAYSGARDFQQDERFQLISVTRYVTRAFPPSFISSGNGDPLARQAVAFAERLEQLGVRVDALFFPPDRQPPLPHEFQFNLDNPGGREALNRLLAFLYPIRERLAIGQLTH